MPKPHNQSMAKALERNEGVLLGPNMLAVRTGKHTARCAHAKYIVDEPGLDIHWNEATKPLNKATFDAYWHASNQNLASETYQVGNHSEHSLAFKLSTELNWHQLFASMLFFPSTQASPEWHVRCVPSMQTKAHPTLIAICFSEKKVLITGTAYAGEIKKAMFTVMNYILPEKDILSMHCAAILNKQSETSLLLGLSGTGKTSLSAAASHAIIGDDEHAWCDEGIFNIEAGCYAKCAHLCTEDEPEIHAALQKSSVLENVLTDQSGQPNFNNLSITENIRAAYKLTNLPNAFHGIAPHPKHIIYLCCDLYGVIPALSKLNPEQAIAFFLSGYTAKVGSTEVNSKTLISPVSSPCFGLPFFPRPPEKYAKMLAEKISRHNSTVWLVNTGWVEGDYYTGKRIDINVSKQLIHRITNNLIKEKDLHNYAPLNLLALSKLDNINILQSSTWQANPQFLRNLNEVERFLTTEKEVHA